MNPQCPNGCGLVLLITETKVVNKKVIYSYRCDECKKAYIMKLDFAEIEYKKGGE